MVQPSYVLGKPGICFHYYWAVYDDCKYLDTFWFADRTRLFVQYTIPLPSLCKLIWRHWTYKMPVRYFLSSVWVRLSIFSPLSIIQYVGLYAFSLPISRDDWENMYTLSYYHYRTGSINYYPLFRVRSWNNGVRCMSFYILMGTAMQVSLRWMICLEMVGYIGYYFLKYIPRTGIYKVDTPAHLVTLWM